MWQVLCSNVWVIKWFTSVIVLFFVIGFCLFFVYLFCLSNLYWRVGVMSLSGKEESSFLKEKSHLCN